MSRLTGLSGSNTSPYCYSSFKNYLERHGFKVYPIEFDCGDSAHPLVDIAARYGTFFWAFEYKSKCDSIQRGLEQVRCYSHWFDYVVLVSEKKLGHATSENYWRLVTLGAGIWNYYPSSEKCVVAKNPLLQSPELFRRRSVVKRFEALSRTKSKSGGFRISELGHFANQS